MKRLIINSVLMMLAIPVFEANAQKIDSMATKLQVLARTSVDSIVLRWAPLRITSWLEGNRFGYIIERYVIVRDKKIVSPPEKTILTPIPIRPLPLDDWESLVKQDKYAAVAAQSLYGEIFELTVKGTDIFQIVNKVKENEQRFSFALFSADMSAPVSIASGLRFTDKNVKSGEKYLYRVSCIPNQTGYDTLKGSIFTGPEKYNLPKPFDFSAEFTGNIASLRWDQSYHKGIYSAYTIERSANGIDFMAVSEYPLVILGGDDRKESRYQYVTDSLPDNINEYHYQVRGLTPFGEVGPASDVVKGRGSVSVGSVPHIEEGMSENNRTIKIKWDFPDELNKGIEGFNIERSETPKNLVSITKVLIAPEQRTYEDASPRQTNYYQVSAVALDGQRFKSPMYYVQLIDSTPPSFPKGLKGTISDKGLATIAWTPNTELDIYGYRIYRGNNLKEEFSQITREPIPQSSYFDSVNLNTLNRQIHYQVMAIDRNQNYSALSEILTLELPDKVKPVSPIFLPTISTREGIMLEWLPSSSVDVNRYDVYRKEGPLWKKISSVNHTLDSTFQFLDKESLEGKPYAFTIIAVDRSGLESEPASPVSGAKIINPIKPPVSMQEPEVDRTNKKIVLRWSYTQQGVERYQVYRAKEGDPLTLYSTITGSNLVFEDKRLVMNSRYTYRLVALFTSGAMSEFSKEVKVAY